LPDEGVGQLFCIGRLVSLAPLRDYGAGMGRTAAEGLKLRIEEQCPAQLLAAISAAIPVIVLQALDVEHHSFQQQPAGDAVLVRRQDALDPLGARNLPHQFASSLR
jgi:hypothetical protein